MAGPVAWNSLPLDIRSAPTLSTFKNMLNTFLLTFLHYWLTVSRVREANIVQRPCSDSSHVTAPYKMVVFPYCNLLSLTLTLALAFCFLSTVLNEVLELIVVQVMSSVLRAVHILCVVGRRLKAYHQHISCVTVQEVKPDWQCCSPQATSIAGRQQYRVLHFPEQSCIRGVASGNTPRLDVNCSIFFAG